MKKRILLVDDEKCALDALRRALKPQSHAWQTTFVEHPEAAWELLLEGDFDAVVADVNMPGINGLQLVDRMQHNAHTAGIPVIVLTEIADGRLTRHALSLGAVDLLHKPVQPEDLLARLRSVLRQKAYQDELKNANALLEERVQQRTEELFRTRLEMIWRLGKAAEMHDEETGNHGVRVGCISRVIAEGLGMNRAFVETLFLAAPLHDIGKIGISPAILSKPGPLNAQEWAVMRQHCGIGEKILREDSQLKRAFVAWRGDGFHADQNACGNPLLEMAATVCLSHHEKYEGGGYPQGLAGEDIPLEGRIVAIGDVFDALVSRRPYRAAFSEDRAVQMIREGAGSHFDPDVHAAFVHCLPAIREVRQQLAHPRATCADEQAEWDETRWANLLECCEY